MRWPSTPSSGSLPPLAKRFRQKCPRAICPSRRFPATAPKKGRRRRHGAQGHQSVQPLRCLRHKMPGTGHPEGRPHEGGRKGVHLLHALRCGMPAGRPQGQSAAALCGRADAEKVCSERKECELLIFGKMIAGESKTKNSCPGRDGDSCIAQGHRADPAAGNSQAAASGSACGRGCCSRLAGKIITTFSGRNAFRPAGAAASRRLPAAPGPAQPERGG